MSTSILPLALTVFHIFYVNVILTTLWNGFIRRFFVPNWWSTQKELMSQVIWLPFIEVGSMNGWINSFPCWLIVIWTSFFEFVSFFNGKCKFRISYDDRQDIIDYSQKMLCCIESFDSRMLMMCPKLIKNCTRDKLS